MPTDEQKREIRRDKGLAAALIAAGALTAGISLAMLIVREPEQVAQGTPAPAEKMTPPINPLPKEK